VVSPDLDTFAADLTAGVADVGTVHYRGPTGPTTSPERTSCGREEEAKSLPHRPNEPDRVPLRQAPRRLPAPRQERHVAPPYGRSAGQTLVVIRLPGGPGEPAKGRGLPHIG